MLKHLALTVALVGFFALPAFAQSQAAKEAEIKSTVPYATMLRAFPTLTIDEYNQAVRELARTQSTPTSTSSSASRVGGTTYYDNGVTGTRQRLGQFDYYNFSNGTTGTTQRLGSFDYYNFVSPRGRTATGTSQQLGSFQYYNFSNGLSGTAQQLGSFRYDNFSNGTSCTSQTIGTFVYRSCY